MITQERARILVVEDDAHISAMLCELLANHGCEPCAAYSGTEALLRFRQESFDLVLLDLMLPGLPGGDVLTGIRAEGNTPVIALTAVDDKESVVSFLKDGANDYITKPFDNDELLARIEVQLRSSQPVSGSRMAFRDLMLDTERYEVSVEGHDLKLSKREFEILKLLMQNPRKVFTKNNLYESVWGDAFLGDDNTVNVHISKIRSKIAAAKPDEEYIQTVWGIGFKMKE